MIHFVTFYMKQNKSRKQTLSRGLSTDWKSALNMYQISSFMAAIEGPVAEFSSFANFEEKKRKSNLLMSFPKIGNQMGSFGQIRKNSLFRLCRPILDIFGITLLSRRLPFLNPWRSCCSRASSKGGVRFREGRGGGGEGVFFVKVISVEYVYI